MSIASWVGQLMCSAAMLAGDSVETIVIEAESVKASEPVVSTVVTHKQAPVMVEEASTHCDCATAGRVTLVDKVLKHKKHCGHSCESAACGEKTCHQERCSDGLFGLLKKLFHCKPKCDDVCCPSEGEVIVSDTPASEASPLNSIPTEQLPVRQVVTSLKPVEEPKPVVEAKPIVQTKAVVEAKPLSPERAADFKWVQGQLHWVHVNGGAWVIRYAPLDKSDVYGGSVVLSRDRRMNEYHEGDFVRVNGEVINEKSTVFLGGPLYRVHEVSLLRSAKSQAAN